MAAYAFVRGPLKKEEIKLRPGLETEVFSHLFKSNMKHRKLALSIGERSEPRENARARVDQERRALPRPPPNVPKCWQKYIYILPTVKSVLLLLLYIFTKRG